MSAEGIAASTPLDDAATHAAPTRKTSDREFHVGLACAVALHALLLVGVVGFAASPDEYRRRMGEKSGDTDGISVVLVNEADLRSRNTVPLDGGQPPGQATPASQPKQAAEAVPPQEEAKPEEQKPEPEQQKPEPEQQKAEPQPKQPQKQAALDPSTDIKELLSLPDLAGKPPTRTQPPEKAERSEPKKQPEPRRQAKPQRPQQETAALPPSPPGEAYPAFARPAGITRSGENDDFARGVIRALRQTMPPGRGTLGRVTIRFLLSENGNMVDVKVVATSGTPSLTQDVVFASRQSNFPFPPRGSTVADRTFLVTYVYE